MSNDQKWSDLLASAVSEPGVLSSAYSAFHNYSIGNQMAAYVQLMIKGVDIGPIATFKGWQEKGRTVKKGEKAIALCMPITVKKKDAATGEDGKVTWFAWRNNWFALSQTEGEEFTHEIVIPSWDKARALESLNVTLAPFYMISGNIQGYAQGREVAINPLAVLPNKTLFHELAHVVLGHTADATMSDDEAIPQREAEVEAEATAYILCSLLGLPGIQESRGYIQNWLAGNSINEKSAQRIFSAADKILKAGKQQGVTA